MKVKLLAALCIAVGLGFMLYPTLRDYYYEIQQQQIVSQWQDNHQEISDGPTEETSEFGLLTASDEQIQTKEENAVPPYSPQEVEALLIIDKIKLRVPVLRGVNERNLTLAVASIESTGKPGGIGNYCISGHRSRSYGLQFNRLDELDKGDRLIVETQEASYTYLVSASFIVQPEDVQVLRSDTQKRMITLVTCDYSSKPYTRLIVQGELL